MINNHLSETEKKLSLLREQLDGMERTCITAAAEERTRIKQRIREEIMPEIRRYEEEYWHIIENQLESLQISESEAKTIVAEIVNKVDEIEMGPLADHSDEVMQILQEIRNKLNQPESSAVGKVKGMISSIPPFIGVFYEADLGTEVYLPSAEDFFNRYFPTFTHWIKVATKKK